MYKLIAILSGVVTLLLVNVSIVEKEQLLNNGRVLFLQLAPVDPRSLMQGDYMALRFDIGDAIHRARTPYVSPTLESYNDDAPLPADSHVIVKVDPRGIARFQRLDDGSPPQPDEARLLYRVRNGEVKFATNAFFFQEGHAQVYEKAEYGEFRVAADGEMLLAGLRDAALQALKPPVQ